MEKEKKIVLQTSGNFLQNWMKIWKPMWLQCEKWGALHFVAKDEGWVTHQVFVFVHVYLRNDELIDLSTSRCISNPNFMSWDQIFTAYGSQ